MATIGTAVTLRDFATRLGPDRKIEKSIIEQMTEQNEVLQDMMWVEGNLPTGHLTTIRSGLPSVTWRKLNYGVQPSKSTTKQVTDACGMIEAYAEVDKALAILNGNSAEWRASEDLAFLESMNQTLASALFYGDSSTDPEKIMGLAPRYDTPTGTNSAISGWNMFTGGGSGSDNTSIWLVGWGPNTCHGIYPKGSMAGFSRQDLGEQTLFDTATPAGRYQGYRTHYKWDCGLTLRDWRYVVRCCNIDHSALVANSSAAGLIALMIRMLHKLPNRNACRPVFYCNSDVITMLEIQLLAVTNAALSWRDIQGQPVLTFQGVPVRRCDQILNTEATISGTFVNS